MKKTDTRIDWIDQVRGFSIFLVVYGHSFPAFEQYIYAFHVPLFFLISGLFHPVVLNSNSLIKRFKSVLIPYFLWSLLLFLFWLFLGRFYGESANFDVSVLRNFIGIFYAQGGREFMDWGIPMWFLPAVFLTFLFFSLIQQFNKLNAQIIALALLIVIGFMLPYLFQIHFLWSLDIALVALIFYSIGFFFKNYIVDLNKKKSWVFVVIFGIIHFTFFSLNSKVDMYRSIYGNEFLFIINGISGTLFYLMLIKNIPIFKFLSYIGKSTISILALHLRALTVIKFVLLIVFGITVFSFTELQKFLISIIQILILIPVIYIINKYLPILNGKVKKI